MASISRCKSASVRAAPFTRATTFAVGLAGAVACVDTVLAAREDAAVWACAARAENIKKTDINFGLVIIRLDCIVCSVLRFGTSTCFGVQPSEEQGEGLLPPRIPLGLESRAHDPPSFVGLIGMARAAKLG